MNRSGYVRRPKPIFCSIPLVSIWLLLAFANARAAQADNTRRAYETDWTMFASWLRRQGLSETPPDPEAVGLYLAAQVERGGAELAVATLERPLRDETRDLTEIGLAAADCLARAIARGVYEATALPFPGALPAWRDRFTPEGAPR